jgi:hypothetical protein
MRASSDVWTERRLVLLLAVLSDVDGWRDSVVQMLLHVPSERRAFAVVLRVE